MRRIRDVAGRELAWVWVGDEKAYELRSGDDVVGRLRWEKDSLASGETATQGWTFNMVGFWRRRLTIREPGSNVDVALFRPSWNGGGTLELGTDRELRFIPANFWRTRWDWVDEVSHPLVHLKDIGGFFRWTSRVVVERDAAGLAELPLLVVLGWYRFVQNAKDAQPEGG
jgi:hypothetical protein